MDAFGLGLNYFEASWLRKTGSENAAKEKMDSFSEQIGVIEKTLNHYHL